MMVFLVPIIAIILLIWAIDAIYYKDEPSIAPTSYEKNSSIQKEAPQNYLDKYIKKK